jgi:hypothetical protein
LSSKALRTYAEGLFVLYSVVSRQCSVVSQELPFSGMLLFAERALLMTDD